MPNRIEAGSCESTPNSHREANATAPVLDSTPHYTSNRDGGPFRDKLCYRLLPSTIMEPACYFGVGNLVVGR
jgi:hypothetical protein